MSLPPKKPMPPRYIAVPLLAGGTPVPIPTPTITATTVNSSQINLKISYSGPPGALSYAFEQATSGTGPFVPLSSGTSNSFSDTGLLASTTYYFRGRVQVNDGRFSDYTPIVSATTINSGPATPTNLIVTSTTTTSIALQWNSVPQATSYNLYRGGTLLTSVIPSSGGGGTLIDGTSFTATSASGGFGSKTSNSLIWDDCSGTNLLTKWSGFFAGPTQTFGTAYRTPAQTPYGVGVANPQNTKFICGVHDASTASDALDVGFYNYRNFVEGSWSVWDYDSRLNPSWTFNLNPDPVTGPDNNFKSYGLAGGHDNIYGDDYGNGTAGHVYDGATPRDLTALNASWGLGFNDDSGGGVTNMYGTKSNQYGWWNSANKTIFSAWSKWTRVTKWTATNGNGYETIQVDYGQTADWFRTPTSGGGSGTTGSGGSGAQTFYTDALNDSTGTLRTEGLGGYTRNYPASTNWRYWANIYFDFGLNPGRFYLGNASTLAACTVLQVQPWISGQYSDNSVGLLCVKGNLPSGTVWLYFVSEVSGNQSLGTRTLQ